MLSEEGKASVRDLYGHNSNKELCILTKFRISWISSAIIVASLPSLSRVREIHIPNSVEELCEMKPVRTGG